MLLPQAVASDAPALQQGVSHTSSQLSSEVGSNTVKQVPEVDFLQSCSDDTEILSLAEHFLDGEVSQDDRVQWVGQFAAATPAAAALLSIIRTTLAILRNTSIHQGVDGPQTTIHRISTFAYAGERRAAYGARMLAWLEGPPPEM
jgi:hypothetical protein